MSRVSSAGAVPVQSSTLSDVHVCSPTDEELGKFFYNLSKSSTKSSILSLVPPCSDNYIPSIVKGVLPRPLTDLYDKKLFSIASFSELSSACDEIAASVTMSIEHSKAVERATQTQSQCKLWYVYRAGRITA